MVAWASAADATLGRIVRMDRGVATVLTESGVVRAGCGADLMCAVGAVATAAPCTGDWCVVRAWPDHRLTLERILPRSTAVVRATAGEQSHGQVLCTNADYVAVVASLQPLPVVSKLERLLALAWDSGAQPLVVLTKADLVRDAQEVAEDVAAAAPGVEVVVCSIRTGQGVERLRALVSVGRTIALVGSSGQGKSALTNALVGTEVLATKDIRDDGRGRHTSVRRELVVLPTGGAVIDTPGLRGVGLIDADEGIAATFRDIEELVRRCRFNNCSHRTEPGCAVRAALEEGSLSARRFESWCRLRRETQWMATRKDARLRAARRKDNRLRDAGPAS